MVRGTTKCFLALALLFASEAPIRAQVRDPDTAYRAAERACTVSPDFTRDRYAVSQLISSLRSMVHRVEAGTEPIPPTDLHEVSSAMNMISCSELRVVLLLDFSQPNRKRLLAALDRAMFWSTIYSLDISSALNDRVTEEADRLTERARELVRQAERDRAEADRDIEATSRDREAPESHDSGAAR